MSESGHNYNQDRELNPGQKHDPVIGEPLPDWLDRLAETTNTSKQELLIMSKSRDPCNIGASEAHHVRAQWIAKHWEDAVANRQDKRLYPRDLHYIMLEKDVRDPTGRCSWTRYTNTTMCAQYCSESLVYARVLGYIPFEGVIDKGATMEALIEEFDEHQSPGGWYDYDDGIDIPDIPDPDEKVAMPDSFSQWIDDAASRNVNVRIDGHYNPSLERQQPFYLELWSEKTLPTEVKHVAQENGVATIIEHGGKPGYTAIHDFVESVNELEKPGVILWLSDYDPSGNNMPAEVASKVDYFERSSNLNERVIVDRVALTKDQVTTHDLPSIPVDPSDNQSYQTKVKNFGDEVTELNALKADLDLFCEIVEDAIRQYRDPHLEEKNRRHQAELKEQTDYHFGTHFRAAIDQEDFEEVQEWTEEFREKWEEAKDVLQDLQEMQLDPRYTDWREQVREAAESGARTAPAPVIPKGEPMDEPDEPFYDSALSRDAAADRINDQNNEDE